MTEPISASSPVLSRPLVLGIASSLLLHALAFFGPQVDLRPLPDLQRLDVTLVRTAPQIAVSEAPPPAPPAAPAPRQQPPRPKTPPKVAEASLAEKPAEPPEVLPEAPPTAETTPEPSPEPVPETTAEPPPDAAPATAESPAAEDADVPAEATAVAGDGGQAWPRAGRIAYMALMGEKQIPMGRATHQWEVSADARYRISELVEPTAVAAIPWYRPGRKLRESVGRITPEGLRPERFTEREDGRPGELLAELDRDAGEFRSAGGKEALPGNAQDMLSLLYQLGYPGMATEGPLPVTSGGALLRYELEVVGDENVRLPFGERWRARHVRARYGSARDVTDVWLATDHFGLPILIRTVDKGVVYYLVATEVMVSKDALPAAGIHTLPQP